MGQFCIGLAVLSLLFVGAKYSLMYMGVVVPPALLGITVLFVALLLKKSVPTSISKAAIPLLRHMSLFFIPAIVAIVNFTDIIIAFPVALFIAIVICTLVSLAVTAWVSQWLMHMLNPSSVSASGNAANKPQGKDD